MEAYKAKAIIWNIPWEGHEIRFEFVKKWTFGVPQTFLFFDGKRLATFNSSRERVSGMVKNENGNSYLIECGVYSKSNSRIQWPLSKSFWGRISDWIDRLLTSTELNAWFTVNDKLIYQSHIGGADTIEWVEIQQELEELIKEEHALAKGKTAIHTSNGIRWEKASKDWSEQTKKRLANTRKGLKARLSDWEAKNK